MSSKVCVIKHFCHFQFSLRQQFSQGVNTKDIDCSASKQVASVQINVHQSPAEKRLKGNVGMMHTKRMFRSLTRNRKIRSFSPHFSSLCKNQNVINRGCGIYKLTTVQVVRIQGSPRYCRCPHRRPHPPHHSPPQPCWRCRGWLPWSARRKSP